VTVNHRVPGSSPGFGAISKCIETVFLPMSSFAGVAQLVEQLTCNEKVEGSIPFSGTSFLSIAQPGSAPALGAGGREFDPLYSDQNLGVV
jgi:hypothetical protein